MKIEQRLREQLQQLSEKSALRSLRYQEGLVDFCSNDYLGLARSEELKARVAMRYNDFKQAGATGSRLLSGQHPLMEEAEALLSNFHAAPAALVFNSGYDANLALLGTLPRRGDIVLYDSLVHASIHDGMRMSKAENIAFRHNDIEHLESLLSQYSEGNGQVFVAIESLYSMDGDIAPIAAIVALCERFGAALLVDEAHATGVLGPNGSGLVQAMGLEDKIFARVHTFGKAIGGHGAVVLGSALLRDYLINFARPFIFSTALSMHSLLHIIEAYKLLALHGEDWRQALQEKVNFFNKTFSQLSDKFVVLPSTTPIQGIVVPGNEAVMALSLQLQAQGFDVRPIRYPTVPKGTERLRICLHLFNTEAEMLCLADFIGR